MCTCMGVCLGSAARCASCHWRRRFPPPTDGPQVRQPHHLPVHRHLIHSEIRVPETGGVTGIEDVLRLVRICMQ